jgi:hypothetical protein
MRRCYQCKREYELTREGVLACRVCAISTGLPFDDALDLPLEVTIAAFEADATSECVPLGMALIRFSMLLSALDYNLYHTGEVSMEEARIRVKWASELMDKKFDIPYERLPQ